jgi:hypothetical protein
MDLGPWREAASCAATQELPNIVWNQKVYYEVHKSPPLAPIVSRINLTHNTHKQIPWPESASVLHRPSDRRLSAKLVLTFADEGCHVVSVTDP